MSISFSQSIATPGSTSLSAKGDILVHDGTNPTRIAVGANGLVLAAQSTATTGLSWSVAPSASTSYYTKISYNTLTASEAAAYTFSNISSEYRDLRLIVQGRSSNTGYNQLGGSVQINSDSTSTNYMFQVAYCYSSGLVGEDEYSNGGALGSSAIGFYTYLTSYGSQSGQGIDSKRGYLDMTIFNYATTDRYKVVRWMAGNPHDSTYSSSWATGLWKSTSAISSLTVFIANSQTLGNGSVIALYGLK